MILLGNIVAFSGCIIMVLIGFVKEKKKILLLQCVQCAFMGTGNLLLGGVSGFISNGVSIVRNLVLLKYENTPVLKIGFIAVQVLLTVLTGDGSMIQWLPVIATVIFVCCFDLKNVVAFKSVLTIGQSLWLIYDLFYYNYVAVVFDMMTLISTVIGIRMLLKENKEKHRSV